MNETYEELLARAPQDHFSYEFIQFLVDNNNVRYGDYRWMIIENCKYWTPENDWLTAFYLVNDYADPDANCLNGLRDIYELLHILPDFKDRELLLKSEKNRSVKLFHVHLYKKVPDSTPSI